MQDWGVAGSQSRDFLHSPPGFIFKNAIGFTWDPTKTSSNATLSGSNLIATATGGASTSAWVFGTVGKSTGKWYFEIKLTRADGTVDVFAGITSQTPTSTFGGDILGVGGGYGIAALTSTTYSPWKNTSSFGSQFSATPGTTVVGFACDFGANTIDIYGDNVFKTTITTIPASTTYYPFTQPGNGSGPGPASVTTLVNPLTYAAPSGFSPWA